MPPPFLPRATSISMPHPTLPCSYLVNRSQISRTLSNKQEAFKKRRHLHVCDSVNLRQGQKGLCHLMSLFVLYLSIRYDVCEFNSLRNMTISSFLITFDLRL